MSIPETHPDIPQLPAETSGKWLDVIREDVDMVRRWLRVMYAMDRSYLLETPDVFNDNMAHRPSFLGASYYYWTTSAEIVLRIVWYRTRRQYLIQSVGFRGEINARSALDLIVDRSISFLREQGESSAFALVPKRMDNTRILELYDLVLTHPRLAITKEHESPDARRWNIEAPELLDT